MTKLTKTMKALLPVSLLVACGGGSGPGTPPMAVDAIGFNDASISGQMSVSGTTLKVGESNAVQNVTGDFVYTTQAIDIDAFGGTLPAEGATAVLDDGGTLETIARRDFVALLRAQTATDGTLLTVIGPATAAEDLPSGTATFAGTSIAVINDGQALFDLSGSLQADVDFAGGIDVTISNLSGFRRDAFGAETDITNVATLTITDMTLSDGAFSGGSASLVSSQPTFILTGNQALTSDGQIYGPDGTALGGSVVVDDTAGGILRIDTAFVGENQP